MAGLIKRNNVYYAVYYVGRKQKRVSLETDSLQLAKEKVRQLESSLYSGNDSPFPTKTPIDKVVTAYIEDMQTRKTAESVKRDVSYLRQTFGPICLDLELKNVKISEKRNSRFKKQAPTYIEANYFELVTTTDISSFIATQVRRKALAPKTANRFREVLTRLYNWAMEQNGIRMPGMKNPAAKVECYTDKASEISFLTLQQIDEQLHALANYPQLQTMVAVYIFAGLRRAELCWLTIDDVDFTAGGNGMLRIRAKTVNGEHWEPKTKVNRVVPISSALRKYLDRHNPTPVNGNWYFPSPNGKRWDPDNLSSDIRTANEKGGLTWSCLDFRHTFGSQLAQKGESLYKIATLMGNSPEICRRHYAALIPEELVDSVEFGSARALAPEPPPEPVKEKAEIDCLKRPRLILVVNRG